MTDAERIARRFHELYELFAPEYEYGYKTREATAVSWDQVPDQNKTLMIAVVDNLIIEGTIIVGDRDNARF